MNRLATLATVGFLFTSIASAQKSADTLKQLSGIDALKAEIAALKPARVAWREIGWKSCLLEGLRESRATGKPVLLWVFIDRPTDDARC